MAGTPRLLWEPSAAFVQRSRLRAYMDWLATERGVDAASYAELWRWSVADIETFWSSIAEYFDVRFDAQPRAVLGRREMPGARVVSRRDAVLSRARLSRTRRRRDRDPARVRAASAGRDDARRAADVDRAHPGRAAGARRRPWRPRRCVHAEHSRDDRGVSRRRRPRRDLVELLAGLRRAVGRRPLRADRAEGPARRRRLSLRRARPRSHRGRRRDPCAGRRDARPPGLPLGRGLCGRLPRRWRCRARARGRPV